MVTGELRKIGDILTPALARMRTSDQARAYGVWARAAGDAVAANARPRSFARGVLTVECDSSVWANELTYLGGQLLARMSEIDAAHPVRRLRFVSRSAPAPAPTAPASPAPGVGAPTGAPTGAPPQASSRPPAPGAGQDEAPAAAKNRRRDETLDPAQLAAAAEGAQAVRDERLRRAILAALGAARPARRPPPSDGPSANHRM